MSSANQVMEQISGLAHSGSWAQMVALCEDFELDVANTKVLPAYAVQLFGYLLVDNLEAARHLWRRIPPYVKGNHPSIGAVWELAKQLLIGDHQAFFQAAGSQEWEPLLATLNNKLLSVYRQRTISLLSKSYDNISLSSMASHLGLPEEETQRYAIRQGWSFDAATSSFQPGSTQKQSPKSVPLSNLTTLTSYVVHLEQQ